MISNAAESLPHSAWCQLCDGQVRHNCADDSVQSSTTCANSKHPQQCGESLSIFKVLLGVPPTQEASDVRYQRSSMFLQFLVAARCSLTCRPLEPSCAPCSAVSCHGMAVGRADHVASQDELALAKRVAPPAACTVHKLSSPDADGITIEWRAISTKLHFDTPCGIDLRMQQWRIYSKR